MRLKFIKVGLWLLALCILPIFNLNLNLIPNLNLNLNLNLPSFIQGGHDNIRAYSSPGEQEEGEEEEQGWRKEECKE